VGRALESEAACTEEIKVDLEEGVDLALVDAAEHEDPIWQRWRRWLGRRLGEGVFNSRGVICRLCGSW
jgi:hypothetical protein